MTPADLTLLLATLSSLAAPAFKDREAATRRLTQGPGWQISAILAATAHKDPEVAARARMEVTRRGLTKEAVWKARAREDARRLVLKALWSKQGGGDAMKEANKMSPEWARLVMAEAGPMALRLGLLSNGQLADKWRLVLEDLDTRPIGSDHQVLGLLLFALSPFVRKVKP